MRVYIPAFTNELSHPHPQARPGWTAVIPSGTHPEQAEVFEDDAVTEAALDGLSLLRDEEPPAEVKRLPRRLVLAVEVPNSTSVRTADAVDEESVVCPVEEVPFTWNDVAAIMIDDADAENAVRRVLGAATQEQADDAISDLWEYSIGWFDIAERLDLGRACSGKSGGESY